VALAPIAIVLALLWRGVLSDDAFGRTVVAAVSWAAVSLLMALDPLLVSRLSATRDLVSVLRGEARTRQTADARRTCRSAARTRSVKARIRG
jgi:hypothetical protein